MLPKVQPNGLPYRPNSFVFAQGITNFSRGNTHLNIIVYDTVIESGGSDLTYVHDIDLGDSIIINTDGIYTIYLTCAWTSIEGYALSLNATYAECDTAQHLISQAHTLAVGASQATYPTPIIATRYFRSGDVIRGHNDVGASVNTSAADPRYFYFKAIKIS